jgi:hypothetical protein
MVSVQSFKRQTGGIVQHAWLQFRALRDKLEEFFCIVSVQSFTQQTGGIFSMVSVQSFWRQDWRNFSAWFQFRALRHKLEEFFSMVSVQSFT